MNLIYSSNTKIFNADKSDLASKFKYSEFLKKKKRYSIIMDELYYYVFTKLIG